MIIHCIAINFVFAPYFSVTLILVFSDGSPSDIHGKYLLEMVFNSLVLLVGLHELESISNVERLKKEVKVNRTGPDTVTVHNYDHLFCPTVLLPFN